jgi:hypothetical protein
MLESTSFSLPFEVIFAGLFFNELGGDALGVAGQGSTVLLWPNPAGGNDDSIVIKRSAARLRGNAKVTRISVLCPCISLLSIDLQEELA